MLSSTDASGLTTTYSYENGGRTVIVTRPGGAIERTEKYLCGKIKSVTGTGVIPRYHTYGVNSDGTMWTKVTTAYENGPRYVKTTTDALGRVIKTERPAFGGGVIVSRNFYNSKGQLARVSRTGMADTLYEYDELGNMVRSGLDIDGDGQLAPASMDRISDSETLYANEGGTWFQVSTTKTYPNDNDPTAVVTSISKRQLTNLPAGVTA